MDTKWIESLNNENDIITANKNLEYVKKLLQKENIKNNYNLDMSELMAIVSLQESEDIIQQDAYRGNIKKNTLSYYLIKSLDSALKKLPPTSEKEIYRNESVDNNDYKVNQIFEKKGFFTASKENFENADRIWIIRPKSGGYSKAHDIYEVYDHCSNYEYPEYQIEFERGTKFEIKEIEKVKGREMIYIDEL